MMKLRPLLLIGLAIAVIARAPAAQTDILSDQPIAQQSLGVAAEGLAISRTGLYVGIATTRGLILQRGDQIFLDQPVGHLSCVDFSPDERWVAAGGREGTIRVWDLDRKEVIRTLQGHRGVVASVKFSPDGRQMLSGSWDGSVILWRTDTWNQVRPMPGNTDEVYAVAFSPDGTLMAAGGWDRSLRIWKGEISEVLKADSGVLNLAFSPDGKHLAAGTYEGAVAIWSAGTAWTPVAAPREKRSTVRSLAFSPDGNHLVSGHEDGGLCLWGVSDGRVVKAIPHRGSAVTGLGFDLQNRRLISLSRGGEMTFWKATIPEALASSVDVDENIPRGKAQDPNAIAVILGVEQYRNANVPPVPYARRDAAVFKGYATQVLGVPDDPNHLYFKTDDEVTKGEIEKLFTGNGWLAKRVQPGANVYVYYAGHGTPEMNEKRAYILPADGDANYPTQTGFSLDRLYEELAKLPATSITVFLDACFSGGTRENTTLLAEARPVFIQIENPVLQSDKLIAFAASTGKQISSSYPEKRHGLFTYFLLKGLRGEADGNQDRTITVAELELYLTDNVGKTAGQLDREQTPQVTGMDKSRVLVRF